MAKRIKDMEFVYTLMAALSGSAQSIIGGFYNKRKASPFKYGLLSALSVAIFFVVSSGFKHSLMGVATGVFNGVVNLLIMVLVGMMSSSLVFPLYSGISLVVSVIASRIFFKKNPDLLSYIAIGIGLVAIVLLNIK
jgi:multidrug transporter EmrE-like cation transporter